MTMKTDNPHYVSQEELCTGEKFVKGDKLAVKFVFKYNEFNKWVAGTHDNIRIDNDNAFQSTLNRYKSTLKFLIATKCRNYSKDGACTLCSTY